MLNWPFHLPHTPLAWFEMVVYTLVPFCATILFAAIFINFMEARHAGEVARERRSFVATGSMMLFCLAFYLIIHSRAGVLHLPVFWHALLMGFGAVLLIIGTLTNILGRLSLGMNWANQATLYHEQTIVTSGVFRLVRHPLYASLIWIFFAVSVIYQSWPALLANVGVFLPMMYYRAHLEEGLLLQRFPEYAQFRRSVGAFFPRLIGGRRHESL
ncbi:MAG TPA: isoprenylcysteine carboxylmethyltransferase family protein [Armatimonadota bacterium]|nr:isoprenylcysteine carboxylmethyltransferase family protein [Armatimonadota bacterium]